jgi:excisionase family DNA binding protein
MEGTGIDIQPPEPPGIPSGAFFRVSEVAAMLRVGDDTVRAAIGLGLIPVVRLGRAARIPGGWLRRLSDGHRWTIQHMNRAPLPASRRRSGREGDRPKK